MAEVLDRYAKGWSMAEMAEDLGIKVSTVTEYLDRIRENYGVSSRRDLVRLAELVRSDPMVGEVQIRPTADGAIFAYSFREHRGTVVAESADAARQMVLDRFTPEAVAP